MGGVLNSGRFDPTVNGPVGARGESISSGGVLDWNTTKIFLEREEYSVYNGSFWSGVCYIPRSSIQAGQKLKYKFFIENDNQNGWENNVSDRELIYTTSLIEQGNDTTVHWVYFDNLSTLTGVEYQSSDNPAQFSLQQNYPNPFNSFTTVGYQLSAFSNMRLVIYNIRGRKVRTLVNSHQQAGIYQIDWDGTNDHNLPIAAGVYFCRMEAGGFVKVIKLALM